MTNHSSTREPEDRELAEALACMREFVLPTKGPITDAQWSAGLAWGTDIDYTDWDLDLARHVRRTRTAAQWRAIARAADDLRARWGCPERFAVALRLDGGTCR